ncbi:glycosyl transferase family 2 [Clostridium sp. CAG:411]|jgi:glucosyltransferase|nr:glycosyltransferase family 2 protein [Lachnospiraceae bacterium]CDE44156.1 glycosyl transferase family 2 [Clostridium sp. CAG:411]
MKKCSVVVPCYNEEETIPIFYKEIQKYIVNIPQLEFEFIFVDDGSKDASLQEMKALAAKDKRVKYISFSRNFGKEAGLFAGLEATTGDYIVTMDVDLQDPPYLLEKMYQAVAEEGYDCAATRRTNRKGEARIRSWFAKKFYQIINKISNADIVDGARDYRFMTRQMVDSILSMREYNRFTKGIFGWIGFKTKWIPFENVERSAGTTKWSFWKLTLYALEGIIAFSTTPLWISSLLGIFCCFVSLLALAFIIIRALMYGDPVAGWPSMISVIIFIGGLQLFCMGILGMYVSKLYLEAKRRPIYITRETNIKTKEE